MGLRDDIDLDLISSYCGLLSLATLSIYAGSFASLYCQKVQEEDDEDDEIVERLTKEDAWLFPVMGSGVLLSLYLILKYLGKEWINYILGWYFAFIGIGSVWKLGKIVDTTLKWRTPALLLFPVSLAPSLIFLFYKGESKLLNALVNNAFGISFSHNALALMKLDSFVTGTILLCGTRRMNIFLATSLDLPMKILWPKSMRFSTERGFTLLGLGDIVVPTPYFKAALTAYITGLTMTMVVMHTFRAAQPALLYLSPACVLSFVITGWRRGELKDAWAWSDDPAAEKANKDKQEKSE
ncbi:signal peptide peptidase-domain-containing protein [Flagelloscypha sp. PMI_526]|nr:signal peptide peptidase-domain-containing protein [Flagelloscypha sp. PMI_526]